MFEKHGFCAKDAPRQAHEKCRKQRAQFPKGMFQGYEFLVLWCFWPGTRMATRWPQGTRLQRRAPESFHRRAHVGVWDPKEE